RHAVRAARVAAVAVAVPLRLFDQLLEGRHVAFGHQVARPLPAEDAARRVAPGRALHRALALEELEEQRRVEESPVAAPGQREDLLEGLDHLRPLEEDAR